jgi:hypothetical protein
MIGNNLKRDISEFAKKISQGFNKPDKKFVADMVYGIAASKSCQLTSIGRKLNEKIRLLLSYRLICSRTPFFNGFNRITLVDNAN